MVGFFTRTQEEEIENIEQLLELAKSELNMVDEYQPRKRNHSNNAMSYFNKVLKIDPKNIEALKGRVNVHLMRYKIEEFTGNGQHYKETTLKYMDDLIKEYPNDPKLWWKKWDICWDLRLEHLQEECMDKIDELNEGRKENSRDVFEDNVSSKKNIKTRNGLMVQSNGEKMIADFLGDNRVEFDYDEQITLEGNETNEHNYKTQWIRPDFYLTEFDIIIEYWGMKGDLDYDKNLDKKKRLYKEANKRFISIFPEDLKELEETLTLKLKRLGVEII
tara:strand:- start:5872 stop:6696 length:825 start_codon:yes stop_codon:yes gene_type:complete